MEIYYVTAFLLFGFSLTFAFTRGSARIGRFIASLVIPCAALIALWRKPGTDYLIYSNHFGFISVPWRELFDANGGAWERGFVIFAGLFTTTGLPYDALMVTGIVLALALCHYVATRSIANATAFFFALYCLCFMFIPFIRQDLAAALTFLSFHFIVRRKYTSFLLAGAIAMTIHLSAVFILIVIVIAELWRRGLLLDARTLKVALALPLVLGALAYFLIDPARLAEQASVYVAEGFVQGVVDEQTSAFRNSLKFVFYVSIVLLFRYFYRSQMRAAPALQLAAIVIMSFSAISALLVQATPVFSRLSIYLFPFVALVYGAMLKQQKNRSVVCIAVSSMLLLLHFLVAFAPLMEWM